MSSDRLILPAAALVIAIAGVIAVVTMAIAFPLNGPPTVPAVADSHLGLAVGAFLVVALVDGAVFLAVRRRASLRAVEHVADADRRPSPRARLTWRSLLPARSNFLHLQRVPLRALAVTALLSYFLQIAAIVQHYPLWLIVLLTLLPWIPLFGFEAIWKYQHYGFLAIFAANVLLQLGFLVENVAQLASIAGAPAHTVPADNQWVLLARALGTWMFCNALLINFFSNRWLWVAWGIASLHLADELYSAASMLVDPGFYSASGAAGLFASGGVLRLPVARPYVQFAFNYLQLVPLVFGIFSQTGHAYDQFLARAVPGLTESKLVAATGQLLRLTAPAGAVILRQGDPADRFYVIARGRVEVVHEEGDRERWVAELGPGQYFGEIGLLMPEARRSASVRALTPVELLTLDRQAFSQLTVGSEEPHHNLEVEVARRLAELTA